MRPTIGIVISTNKSNESYIINKAYIDAIHAAGGLPFLLPAVGDEETAARFLARIDGILMPGGPDVDPVHFGEEPMLNYTLIDPYRDSFELSLARLAIKNDVPILGICRGVQMMNIAAGGDIYQDLKAQQDKVLIHDQRAPRWYPTHTVEVQPETMLSQILGELHVRVNSYHHQAVRKVAPAFRVNATASDGVIEGIESRSVRFALGVQWHPEHMWKAYPLFKGLFTAFVNEASKSKPS